MCLQNNYSQVRLRELSPTLTTMGNPVSLFCAYARPAALHWNVEQVGFEILIVTYFSSVEYSKLTA